ncbi:hypothetical protein GQX73_g9558 [Xylaria multiplex]|uniref:NB-ARC domain-containing protein n=1 Tax=Xylaria multiplex TaxID=323545 RepID=A0A7C8IQK5_9PEZI|nr:hypothetical protein GQX73_g9558 [Xylaria multiplex]
MAVEMKSCDWKWWRTNNRNSGERSATTPIAPENQPIVDNSDDKNEDNSGLRVFVTVPTVTLVMEIATTNGNTPSIVCTHELNGHWEETWTGKAPETGRPVFWIKDLLPADLPHARIMTYGYSSQVSSVKYLTQRTLYSQSKVLLTTLKRSRQDGSATNRPIIFIAHSLGGLVVKSALIHADRDDHAFNDIRVYLNWLQCQLEQYKSLNTFFPTYCLYEDEVFLANAGSSMTVPRVAATPRELLNTTTLLTASRQQDHMNLCKSQSRDLEYRETLQQLRMMYEQSRDLVSKNILLDQLRQNPSAAANNYGDTFYIPVNLPQNRVTPFLGHDTELRTLYDYLSNQSLVTLIGPHGIGKTQIALEYAYAYQSNYSSVFWVDAQNWFTLYSSFLKITEQLKNHYVGTSRGEERLKTLHYLYLGGLIDEEGRVQSCNISAELLFLVCRKWLERRGNNGWLLIIDGMDRDTDLREFQIGKMLDSPINGHVIITSRCLRRGQTLDVHELEPNDAATLLRQTTRLEETLNSDTLELVNKLGRVPLAIKQAGAFLSSSQWPVPRYSQTLSSNLLPKSRIATLSNHSPLTIVWTISIKQLGKETVELLNAIAFLSDYNIPIKFIESAVEEFSDSEADSVVEKELTTLKEYSLIRYDSATQAVALDPCMSRWLRERIEENPDDYRLRARKACSSVSSYLKSATADLDPMTYTAKQYRVEKCILPYIERCCYDIVFDDYQQVPFSGVMLLQDMHDIEGSLGPAHIRTLEYAVLLASQYQEEGEHAKAEIFWRRANSSQSKTLGDFHPLTLKTATSLAMILQQQGKYSQAKAICSSTRNSIATVLGDDHLDSLRLMVNIAVLYTLERRFEEADEEYRKVLRKMEEKLGPDHEDVKRIEEYRILNSKQIRPGLEEAHEEF